VVLFKHFFREILAPRCYASVPFGPSARNSWSYLSTFFVIFTHFVVVAHSYFCVIPGRFSSFFDVFRANLGLFFHFFCVFWVIFEPVFMDFLRIWSNLCTFLWTHLCLWKLSQRLFSDIRPCLILTIQHHLICHIIKLCNQRHRHLNNEKLYCYNNMLHNNILHIISCSYTTTKSYMVILTHKDVCHQHSFLQQKHPELTDKTFF